MLPTKGSKFSQKNSYNRLSTAGSNSSLQFIRPNQAVPRAIDRRGYKYENHVETKFDVASKFIIISNLNIQHIMRIKFIPIVTKQDTVDILML